MAYIGGFGIFTDHVTQFMSTVNDPTLGISRRKNSPYHKYKIMADWFV